MAAFLTSMRGKIPAGTIARTGFPLTILLAGCTVGPNFSASAPPTERAYLVQPVTTFGSSGSGEIQQRLAPEKQLQANWWTMLGSPDLDRTVELALDNNKTVEVARANMSVAAEQVAAGRGSLFPQVNATGGLGRKDYGASFLGPEAFAFPTFSYYSAGLDVSYDLDIFGGVRRRIERAAADAEAQADVLDAARLTIMGDTVIEALQIAGFHAELDVVRNIIGSDEQNLRLVQYANVSGVASQVDVTTAESQLDSDRALLPPLRQQLDVAQDALSTLVGNSPATWIAPKFTFATMKLPQDIPMVVPSELVRARPDIRAAEARLHAASASVGVATADLYPQITLSAATAEEGLISGPSGVAWSLIGGLTMPIFHGGTLAANRRAAPRRTPIALRSRSISRLCWLRSGRSAIPCMASSTRQTVSRRSNGPSSPPARHSA